MSAAWLALSGTALRDALAVPLASPSREVVTLPHRAVARPALARVALWTAEAFWDAAEAAKRAAQLALGDGWYLVPGHSHHVILPARYRSFRTPRGTRIKVSGDRRYPIGCYWGGMLPPGVVSVIDGPRELSWQILKPTRTRSPRLTHEAATLELTPEEWGEAAD